jgi:hypothetical protein
MELFLQPLCHKHPAEIALCQKSDAKNPMSMSEMGAVEDP